MRQKLLIIGIISLVLLIFAYSYFYKNTPPAQTDYTNAVITMERSGCYGTCPAYSLTVYGNGTVFYDGKNYVNMTGKHTSEISKENVKQLIDEFYKANYFSLNDKYTEPEATDMDSAITSIAIGVKQSGYCIIMGILVRQESLRSWKTK